MKKKFHTFFMAFLLFGFLQIDLCAMEETKEEQKYGSTSEHINSTLDTCIDSFVKKGIFNGVVMVVKDDIVLMHKGYGYLGCVSKKLISPDMKFRLGSVSKQFTALAIIQLFEQGKLNMQDDIKLHIPEFPVEGVTIHNLLTHTSGLPLYWKISGGDRSRVYSRAEAVKIICDGVGGSGLFFNPGIQFRYSASNYVLLGAIVEKVSGTLFENYIQQNIFDRIKSTGIGCCCKCCKPVDDLAIGHILQEEALLEVNPLDALAVPGTGSLYATAEDLYKWASALKVPGILLNQKGLSLMFEPRVKTTPDFMKDSEYAYGWFITHIHGHKCIGHFGKVMGFRAGIFRYVDDNTVIIILSNFEHAQVEPLNNSLAAIIFGFQPELPQIVKPVEIDSSFFSLYEGSYSCNGEQMLIFRDKLTGDMHAQITGHSKQKLFPQSSSTFVLERYPVKFDFMKNHENCYYINIEKNSKISTWTKV